MTPHPSSIEHLYVHIPFCPRKCSYCAFATRIGSLKLAPRYVRAVATEISSQARMHPGGPLRTVYFGGGTPSMLPASQLETVLTTAVGEFGLAPDCEVTLEAHPETVDRSSLRAYRDIGVNRLSFGVESMNDAELATVRRLYNAGHVVRIVREARQAGFDSINLDLIYGLPGSTLQSWARTLESVLELGVEHLALYPLSIEPRTIFERLERRGLLHVPDDDLVVEMYEIACDRLRDAGYRHYEVANWAHPDHRCRHNLAYWHGLEYYGTGAGAHAYLHPERRANNANTARYIESIEQRECAVQDRAVLDSTAVVSERVMLGLRLLEEGLETDLLADHTGVDLFEAVRHEIDQLRQAGLVAVEDRRIRLNESAVPVANEVWGRLVQPLGYPHSAVSAQ